MLEGYLEKKLLDFAFSGATNLFKDDNITLRADKSSLEKNLSFHLNMVKNWSEEVSFFDLKKAKNTESIYVPLNLLVSPLRTRLTEDEYIDDMPLLEALNKREYSNHFVILGQPGAGKTTTMKYICREMLLGYSSFFKSNNFPILIRLREINNQKKILNSKEDSFNGIVWNLLHEILGVEIHYPKSLLGDENKQLRLEKKKGIIKDLLEKLSPVILFDGFDEIVYQKDRDSVLKEIRDLGIILEKSCMIITSRTGDFNYHLDKFNLFEIKELDNVQIKTFAYQWLENDDQASLFLEQLSTSPFKDTAIRPLTIAHLCAIFDRVGSVPEKPKTVYKKIVNLLIEEWDEQRSIKRGSRYSSFESDRKFEFLSNLAFLLTVSVKRTIFDSHDLTKCYNKMYENYGLLKNEVRKVVIELESHTGLFIESGYNLYEFSHKSIQEYLSAEYLVKLPSIPSSKNEIISLANEFAIAISISSNPSEYFSELVLNRFNKIEKLTSQFIQAFLNRLLVEKPDFNRSNNVSWAMISLYSLYFNAITDWKGNGGQALLFIPDSMSNEFNKVSNLLLDKTNMRRLKKVYKELKHEWTDENEKVITVEKKEMSEIMESNLGLSGFEEDTRNFIYNLPEFLMIKE